MSLVAQIKETTATAIEDLYKIPAVADDILVNQTKPEFEGDYTVVLFSLIKSLKKSPEALGKELGEKLTTKHTGLFTTYNVIKGFLNLTIKDSVFTTFLSQPEDKLLIENTPLSN
ncbi:MAG TPA: hypothetical protein VM888_14270, partial [Chitinophagaceae bacterium]|nr:hypothetical protein [Chitinophagaceae bacterium]